MGGLWRRLTTWEEKHYKRWERIRARGKWRFVLLRGILGYGVPMFLFVTFLAPRIIGARSQVFPFPVAWVLDLVLWFGGGAFLAYLLWHVFEDRYRDREGRSEL